MELLLNLAWVLLVLPAYWLWRREASRTERRVSSLQCLLALGCVLVLLFPVISATDDLHAIRAEMEDSAVSKRTVRQAVSDGGSGWINRLQGPPAVVTSEVRLVAPAAGWFEASVVTSAPLTRARVFHGGRAPPPSLLG